ncbi:glyoxalase [Streptomyces carminius]|uniref:Glyoxalase n=1 Tax=Streptomyces carminius TaxID=2665496 RepID=A0A2M8LWE4_9ACTN|nr:VOC family protein [Streptomyces carminius]PJE96288.1 glyoxalase [Streptomyces carminius]
MIKGMSAVTVWSTDQDRDLRFFVEKLGFEPRGDITVGGTRWVTVGVGGQPDVELTLVRTDVPGLDPESVEALTRLVGKGVLGAGALRTDDCRGTYEKLRARGVEFVQEPRERPYGIEAVFRDTSGNRYALTQRREDWLDPSKEWSEICD